MEALVLPHMDDVTFFNTSSAPFSRGGIYGDFLRDPEPTPEEELNGPKRGDREATHEDLGEEELVGGDGGDEVASPAIGTSTATSRDSAAGLRPTAAAFRRRRSSEGDHPPQSSPGTDPNRKPKKAASSSSSLAGLGASFAQWREQAKTGSTTSSAAAAAASRASSNGGNGGPVGSKVDNTPPPARKSTWFGNSTKSTTSSSSHLASNSNGPASSASVPNLITRTPSVLSVASTETTASASDDRDRDRGREEVSAAKLRDILSKRAESRERERRREREIERARELEADKVVAQVGRVGVVGNDAAIRMQEEDTPSAGSAEAEGTPSSFSSDEVQPASIDDAKRDSADTSEETAFIDLHRAESAPAHLRDEVRAKEEPEAASIVSSSSSKAESSGQTIPLASRQDHSAAQEALTTPPSLPARPSWVKSHSPTPSETASVKSSVAPSADLAPGPSPPSQPPPPPPPSHPRHAGSASVDSGGATTLSASASTLLSTWRTRAADKEALAAGVASAKESMRRWGANWAAKRAAQKDRGEEFDTVVGESPDKPRDGSADRYREHRRERESRDLAAAGGEATSLPSPGPAGGYFGGLDAEMSKPLPIAPKTPPRGRAGSSAAAATVEPPASSSSPSTSRLVPSASTPSLALSHSTATAEGSPSTSPAKASHMTMQVPPPSSSATLAMSAAGVSHAGGYGGAASLSSGGISAYGRRTMAVPGIRDEDRKKKVAEDHLGSTAVPVAARTSAVPSAVPLPTSGSVPSEEAASPAEQSEAIKVPIAESATSSAASPPPSSDPPRSDFLPRSLPPPLPVRHVSNEAVPSTETREATSPQHPPPPLGRRKQSTHRRPCPPELHRR